ncbi:hypothetical protein [Pseudotabrizicola alkalilacus]|uniref:Uncharacterized protein n=1 Tax=Pseudotabrizicola alkalilacus TaxID=2305252 RepID=A0A411Z7N2_9RHOB|nr:hypothetical protein [Pseudotabrizicola alkalilacus]RGP39079.1 hypothetical protein D1012_02915 [Pseudotabrizicola alkalilacus]
MTALTSPDTYYRHAVTVTALERAKSATVEYCSVAAKDLAHTKLRDLTPLEAMYAYFGSDEAAA